MIVKIHDGKDFKELTVKNVKKVKPYKTFYGDNYFRIMLNEEEWTTYSRDRYEIKEILEDKKWQKNQY